METFTSKSSYELKLIGDFIFNFADVIKNRFLVRKIHTGYVTKLIMSPIVIMCQEAVLVLVSASYHRSLHTAFPQAATYLVRAER